MKSVTLPPNPRFLSLLDRVDEWLHSMIVIGVRLHQVYDVEPVGGVFARVLHSEEVPLSVAVRPIVILQEEIVFGVADFHNLP